MPPPPVAVRHGREEPIEPNPWKAVSVTFLPVTVATEHVQLADHRSNRPGRIYRTALLEEVVDSLCRVKYEQRVAENMDVDDIA